MPRRPSFHRALGIALPIASLVLAMANACEPKHAPEAAADHPQASTSASESSSSPPHGHAHGSSSAGRRYPVPFAWEASSADPLAITRGFLRDMNTDNTNYMKTRGTAFFKTFADAQKPRATVVTCSDSRVQSAAFDATADNDVFFIRNIGNQITNSQGSVEYGVHHLKTPLLIILGHTGCGAIKAAMGDFSKESPAIKKELQPLSVPSAAKETIEPQVWADAVALNVSAQVGVALALFAHEVESGDLTVVGAVYDFRNDLKQGWGRVVVVNVNGQTDSSRIQGFVRAVGMSPSTSASSSVRKPIPSLR